MRYMRPVWGWVVAVAAFPLLSSPAGAAPEQPADVVIRHARIHTEDRARSVAEALAIRGNAIVAVGSDEAVKPLTGPRTRVIDLGGRVVLPGLIDAHTHPAQSAQDLGKCSLGDEQLTVAAAQAKIGRCLKENPGDPKSWFEVVQVNPSSLDLTARDLDRVLPDRPLVLFGTDGHTIWANGKAIATPPAIPLEPFATTPRRS